MARLYPPVIEGVIPAFYGTELKVPFVMNRSVSNNEFNGFKLKMKTIISGDNPLEEIIGSTNYDFDTNIVIFQLSDEQIQKLYIGQFYKIQIAYFKIQYYIRESTESEWKIVSKEDYEKQTDENLKKSEDEIGHYSTIGVIKYTDQPTVRIESHGDKITYTGIYQSSDCSEKVYAYNFTLVDNLGNIIETTGDRLHNGSADTVDDSSTDSYAIKTTLEVNKEYYLTYSVTTINNITITSEQEKVSHLGGINSSLRADIKCILDEENGCIDVHLIKPAGDESETPAVGTFYLLRASDEDDFKIWNEVLKFVLGGQTPVRHLWTDMSIKHGVTYKYAIQQINKYNLRSGLIESKPIVASFDHMYLYDGKRQLKIKYNPKVSTFKNTLLESKIDTIGSKYPFVFRNGNVNYKEFSISGLISYLSDDNGLFYDTENIFDQHVNYGRSLTNLTSDNITTERDFKLQVLEWITNGKPKLFRSPTEGNYIVRLMNSSMTPNDTLGRMLHTFTSTAYEIAENTYENLKNFNFVHANINIGSQLRWKSIDLKDINVKQSASSNLLNHPAVAIKLEGMLPGSKINIKSDNTDMKSVIIGATGYYEINLNSGTTISRLSLPKSGTPYMGVLTYAYYSTSFEDSFDFIVSVEKLYVPCRQFIGLKGCNLLNEIIDIKTEINNIDYIRFILRNEHPTKVYKKGDVFYTHSTSEENKYAIDLAAYSDLFEVYDKDTNEEYWMDGYNATVIDPNDSLNTKIIINNDQTSSIDLINSWIYELKNPPSITSIEIGAAVIAEIGYTAKDIKYDIEDEAKMSENLKEKNSALESAELFYKAEWEYGGGFPSDLKWAQQNLNEAYKNYIQVLEQEIKKEV